ncbi:hypothetical protein LRAMOSA07340 [Lichtheimia ramosa]|uniref:DH domain-containing protein n=1 Tax=Lichtheimia ramosa TaxID=688394 RepID=A0A077WBI8_9FUNG|nr:hypothetical protein LRAMOSA07340 [Lichtheimia ramosa]
MNTPSPSYSDSPRTSQTLSSRRRPSTTSKRNHSHKYHHHHQSIVSTSSVSSKESSNYASSRYPSGLTSMTGYTSVEVPSICASPTTSTATSHYQQQHTYDAKQLTEDQFDIIDSLDYDDVDDALLDHELVHRNREALVQQLYNSEHAYLESLQLVANIFLNPMRKDAKQTTFSFLGMKKAACTERELRWLFGNFDQILQVQRDILTSLEQRLQIWGPTQIISDVFQNWFQQLNVYKAYLDNYDVAITTYERLTRYQPFKKFIDSAHKNPTLKGATLLSLLQIPAGSINRYAHLISKLADLTTPMHPDHFGLQTCKQRILVLAEEMKPRVDDADNVDQVLMIQRALVGAPFGVKAQRRLVLQGSLSRVVVSSKTVGEEQTYFLFSDLLMFVRPKQDSKRTVLQYKGHLQLEQARIRALSPEDAAGYPYCFEITSSLQGVDTLNSTYMGSRTVYVLRTHSQAECDEWVKQLENVVHVLDQESARARQIAASRRLAHHRARAAGDIKRSSSTAASQSSGNSGDSNTSSRR